LTMQIRTIRLQQDPACPVCRAVARNSEH